MLHPAVRKRRVSETLLRSAFGRKPSLVFASDPPLRSLTDAHQVLEYRLQLGLFSSSKSPTKVGILTPLAKTWTYSPANFCSKCVARSATFTRSCSQVSRSRTVTASSSSD